MRWEVPIFRAAKFRFQEAKSSGKDSEKTQQEFPGKHTKNTLDFRLPACYYAHVMKIDEKAEFHSHPGTAGDPGPESDE